MEEEVGTWQSFKNEMKTNLIGTGLFIMTMDLVGVFLPWVFEVILLAALYYILCHSNKQENPYGETWKIKAKRAAKHVSIIMVDLALLFGLVSINLTWIQKSTLGQIQSQLRMFFSYTDYIKFMFGYFMVSFLFQYLRFLSVLSELTDMLRHHIARSLLPTTIQQR